MLLGVDTGGTFTDFVLLDEHGIRIHKVLSTPAEPEKAILQGIDDLGLTDTVKRGDLPIVHGSTVATNATLEGKGVTTALVTNRGFKDLLSIGRQTRRELYNLQPPLVEPPVPPELCLEIDCRRDARGEVITPLTDEAIAQLAADIRHEQPQAVAINLLFSYLNGEEEERIARAMPDDLFVARSSFVLPEYKEYERGIATWLNAYLGPLVQHYLNRLQTGVSPSPLAIMQSSGGTIGANQASERAVNLLLSGPAGGLAAAKYIADTGAAGRMLTFDMGGTSTDVALIDGDLRITNEGSLGPYPIAVPMVDMHTIGAGGGSIASVDAGGLLQVGPQSAGAAPGPACYGKGGEQATVTDANAVLGRLRPDNFLGGHMTLDLGAAQTALDHLAEQLGLDRETAAAGIVDMANEHMARALRVISVQRGHDPRDFHLCCFGGAGGLHVCALADKLGMDKAIVPRYSGVLSALGMLVAPRERQLSHTHQALLRDLTEERIQAWLDNLAKEGERELTAEGVPADIIQYQPSLDLRYAGQSYTVTVPYDALANCEAEFHQRHEQLYGHRLNRDVELVTLRQRALSPPPSVSLPTIESPEDTLGNAQTLDLHGLGNTRVVHRDSLPLNQSLAGPLLICETVSTTLVAPGWEVTVNPLGHLLLQKNSQQFSPGMAYMHLMHGRD